uniref:Uncharacterized protein n=1 Tax=Peronospora matthiolae TaxID=2874970 RepID=A0AAV1VEY7_9STRA
MQSLKTNNDIGAEKKAMCNNVSPASLSAPLAASDSVSFSSDTSGSMQDDENEVEVTA